MCLPDASTRRVNPDPSRLPQSPAPAAFARIAGKLAIFAAIGAWLGFLAGFAGRWAWPLDLFAHFRIQYAVVLALACVTLLLLRRSRAAVLAFAGAVATTASVIAYTGWHLQPAQAASRDFRFVTFNVFYRNRNLAGIADYLQRIDADVVALQELEPPQARQLAALLPSYPHVSPLAQGRYGTIIFSRWPITSAASVELVPGGARVEKAVIDWRGQSVTLIGAHLHWPIRPGTAHLRNAELHKLAQLAKSIDGPLLVGGDFNITPWSPNFRDAVAESGLQDCAHGHSPVTTWPTFFAPAWIRIDHCLASADWRVVAIQTGPALGSDHYPVVNDFEAGPMGRLANESPRRLKRNQR